MFFSLQNPLYLPRPRSESNSLIKNTKKCYVSVTCAKNLFVMFLFGSGLLCLYNFQEIVVECYRNLSDGSQRKIVLA